MNKIINPSKNIWSTLVKRASLSYEKIEPLAKAIFTDVEENGDLSLIHI